MKKKIAMTPPAPMPSPSQGSRDAWIYLACGLALTFWVVPMGYPDRTHWVFGWLVLGLAALFLGFARLPRHPTAVKDPYSLGRLAILLGLYLFARQGWSLLGRISMLQCMLIALLWVYVFGEPLSKDAEVSERVESPVWALWAATALILAGIWLRWHNLMGIPNGVHPDEIGTARVFEAALLQHLNILTGIGDTLVNSGTLKGEGVYVLFALVVAKLGIHGIYAVRVGQVIAGSLLMPIFYVMMRQFFGWKTALWGLVFLAFSRFGIAGSRLLLYDSPRLVFLCLTMICLGKGTRGSLAWFALAGVLTGLLLYGCHYPQFVIPPLILIYLVLLAFFGKMGQSKGWMALVIFSASTWICFLPMWNAIQGYGTFGFMRRANDIKATSFTDARNVLLVLTNNIMSHLYMYTVKGWEVTWLAPAGEPIMDPYSGMLMFLGLLGACVAWFQRKMEGALMLGWFLATLATGVFSDVYTVPYRISLQTPAMYGLAGLAASQLVSFPSCRPSRLLSIIAFVLVSLFAVKAALWSWDSYFVKYPNDASGKQLLGWPFTVMGREMKAQPPLTELIVTDAYRGNINHSMPLGYTAERGMRWTTTQLATFFPTQTGTGFGAVVFTEPSLELMAENFRFFYPHSLMKLHNDDNIDRSHSYGVSMITPGNPYTSIYIGEQDLQQAMGCRLSIHSAQGTQVIEGAGLEIPSSYTGPWPVDAQWEGSLLLMGASGSYHLSGNDPGGFKFKIGGHSWRLMENHVLGQGMNPFTISLSGVRSNASPMKLLIQNVSGDSVYMPLSDTKYIRKAEFSQGVRVNYYPQLPPRAGMAQAQPEFSELGRPMVSCIEPTVYSRWLEVDPVRARPMPGACLAVYKASMTLPETGAYRFYEESSRGRFKVWVDGRIAYPETPSCAQCKGLLLNLAKGRHELKASFQAIGDPSGMIAGPALMVQGPDSKPLLLPTAWLQPPDAPW